MTSARFIEFATLVRSLVLGACAAACLASSSSAAAQAAKRPNIVVLVTDDQRFDALGVVQAEQGERGRFPWIETPAMDRLAAEGARFRSAFVVNSLCSPSRASILTGRYSHAVGVVDNHTPFPADAPTLAHALAANGYDTGYCGKWHFGRQSGQRPGFAHSASYLGQGDYFDVTFEVDGVATPTEGWIDDVTADFAVRFVKRERENPFFLMVGFKSTHYPYASPERVAGRFRGREPRPTPNLDAPSVYAEPRNAPVLGGGRDDEPAPSDREAESESAGEGSLAGPSPVADYSEVLRAVDDSIARILAALDDASLAEDTLVVLTSDNGKYFGEHGLRDKRSAYEESMRVPLIVRCPGRVPAGRTVDALALNIDLAPTLLELAGAPVPREMHGRSLARFLAPAPPPPELAPWRESFFYGYVAERGFSAPTMMAVRSATHKLVLYPGQPKWSELFELEVDPYETRNRFEDPALREVRAALERQCAAWAAELAFPPEPSDEPAGKRSRRGADDAKR